MKKAFVFMVLVLSVTLLAACNNGGQNDGKIKITYSNWNLGAADSETPNMERLMIQAFEEAHPEIDVVIVERPKVPGTTNDVSWSEFLAARASTESLPDVFMEIGRAHV